MKIPNTYSEWIECFDAAKKCTHDKEVLNCVRQGSLVLSAGVAGRFATQLNAVIEFRIKKASDRFSRAMQINVNDINILISNLLALRKEFQFLIQFVQIPFLPDKDVEILVSAIKDQANTMQESLETTSAQADRTGVLTSVIRKNKVNNMEGL